METQFVQKLVEEITSRKTKLYDVVYFYGNADAIHVTIDTIVQRCEGRQIIRTDGSRFFRELIHNVRNGIRSEMPDCELFILEQLDVLAGGDTCEQHLYGVIDWLLESNRQIIISGSAPVAAIQKLAPRIRAQIEGGISLPVE